MSTYKSSKDLMSKSERKSQHVKNVRSGMTSAPMKSADHLSIKPEVTKVQSRQPVNNSGGSPIEVKVNKKAKSHTSKTADCKVNEQLLKTPKRDVRVPCGEPMLLHKPSISGSTRESQTRAASVASTTATSKTRRSTDRIEVLTSMIENLRKSWNLDNKIEVIQSRSNISPSVTSSVPGILASTKDQRLFPQSRETRKSQSAGTNSRGSISNNVDSTLGVPQVTSPSSFAKPTIASAQKLSEKKPPLNSRPSSVRSTTRNKGVVAPPSPDKPADYELAAESRKTGTSFCLFY